MRAQDRRLISTALVGQVHVRSQVPLALAALHLGAAGQPNWEELRRFGPVCYDAGLQANPLTNLATVAPMLHDMGDSSLVCASNGPATSDILPTHRPCDPRHLPSAMHLAFAQQWARYGHACIHGALLQVADCGVLVLGLRGAGKSVLATSALIAGGAIVSDDYLLAGEHEGVLLGERIRAFMSLRQSWAARALFDASKDAWRPNRSGSRAFLHMEANDTRFPEHCRIDQVWLLCRPRTARRKDTLLEPLAQAELYAALVNATHPILLGPDFAHERKLLAHLYTRLAAAAPARLETGLDIVLDPHRTWQRMLAASIRNESRQRGSVDPRTDLRNLRRT